MSVSETYTYIAKFPKPPKPHSLHRTSTPPPPPLQSPFYLPLSFSLSLISSSHYSYPTNPPYPNHHHWYHSYPSGAVYSQPQSQ